MPPESHPLIDARLASLRQFLSACQLTLHGVRLVQYHGADFRGSIDVALENVEQHVTDSVGDGFRVDWICRNELLYLRVFEGEGAAPSWERVFAEEDLANVRSVLKDAGFENDH